MTIAEIHRKLGKKIGIDDKMEDLLTSDVFGTMKYVGWECGFSDWLRSSKANSGRRLGAGDPFPDSSAIKGIHYRFWPRFDGVEPDLVLEVQLESDKFWILLVEAKYLSGASDGKGNQLASQVNALRKYIPEACDACDISKRVHVYITCHGSRPTKQYKLARNYTCLEDGVSLFWTNWKQLTASLQSWLEASKKTASRQLRQQQQVEDLVDLLRRKGFDEFRAFRQENFPLLLPEKGTFWEPKPWFRQKTCATASCGNFWKG